MDLQNIAMTFQYQLDVLEVIKSQPAFTSLLRQWASESKVAHGLGYVLCGPY